jgi:hypothetical protein
MTGVSGDGGSPLSAIPHDKNLKKLFVTTENAITSK